jgi:hypothetical protein
MENQIWGWVEKTIANQTIKEKVVSYITNKKWDSLDKNKEQWQELCSIIGGLYYADAKDFKLLLKNYIAESNGEPIKKIILHDWGTLTLDDIDIHLRCK